MRWVLFWIGLPILVPYCHTARILALFPFPGRSHRIYSSALLEMLANRGHQIVEYSPISPTSLNPNYTHENIEISIHRDDSSTTYDEFLDSLIPFQSIIGLKYNRIWDMNYYICNETLKHKKIQRLMKSDEKFDLIITESTFGQESILVFGYIFSAPTITIDTFFPWSVLNREAGNTLSIASVPDLTSFVFNDGCQSFKERLLNTISVTLTLWYYYYSHIPKQEQLMRDSYQDKILPSITEMVSNVSLYLTNSQPTVVNYIHSYTPNIIPIGGINIQQGKINLPQHLQTFLDDSKGFIYISFGTVVPLETMPKKIVQIFINVLKKLSLKVLWKYNTDDIEGIPRNVKTVKWVPQMGVLGTGQLHIPLNPRTSNIIRYRKPA